MRLPLTMALSLALAGSAAAQTMSEVGASAAGSAIGSAAGKKVSDGITAIFGKVDTTTSKAAKPVEHVNPNTPLLDVGEGAPRVSGESVPPPPPAPHRASAKPYSAPRPQKAELPAPVLTPAPVVEVTAEDLKKVIAGMSRDEVLKLGPPSSRITMDEDGHLTEIFSYASGDTHLGRLRLVDGAVSTIEIR